MLWDMLVIPIYIGESLISGVYSACGIASPLGCPNYSKIILGIIGANGNNRIFQNNINRAALEVKRSK